jgi:hypothetical protein
MVPSARARIGALWPALHHRRRIAAVSTVA